MHIQQTLTEVETVSQEKCQSPH